MAVIIFKAIEYCNSNCIYCNVIKKDQGHTMTYDLLETVFKRMNEYLEEFPEEKIQFTWHGGEACLLGADYFNKALEFQKNYCPDTKDRIQHLIQSNMTVMTQELVDVFKKLGIKSIGSSYDPIEGMRGIGEDRDSKLYKKLFFEGVKLIEQNGLSWGINYVVHRKSLKDPVGLLNHLCNLNLNSYPNFNCIYLYNEDKNNLGITPEDYADFLGALVPLYLKNPDRYRDVRPISMFIKAINGTGGLVCDYAGICSNIWLYIGPTGDLSHCGKAGDERVIDYGNITNISLKKALNDPKRLDMLDRQKFLNNNICRGCKYWRICHGGCPVEALLKTGDIMNVSPSCKMIKRLMSKYIEPLTGVDIEVNP